MEQDKKNGFPVLPIKRWWDIRERFKKSIPGVVTDSYIASILGMQKASAQANILPALKQIGLIDDDGKTLNIAKKWRDDGLYPEVCSEIISNLYPSELMDAFSDPLEDREGVTRWFSLHTGHGDGAVRKMVSFYLLLAEADVSNAVVSNKKSTSVPKKEKQKRVSVPKKVVKEIPGAEKQSGSGYRKSPELNINLQIHISSDASEDQIEKIFESMAKYLYRD